MVRTTFWFLGISLVAGCATTQQAVSSVASSAESSGGSDVIWKDAATVETVCSAALDEAQSIRDTIGGEGSTPGDILRGFDNLNLAIDSAYGWTQLMFSVHPEKEVREAAEICEKRVSKFLNDVSLDRRLFEAASGIDPEKLTGLSTRFHAHLMRDFRRSGVSKDDATRAKLAKLHEEMVELGQTFQKNVRADIRSVTVDDASALEGMPQDFIDAHAPGDDGKISLTTNYPDFFPIQTYAEDSGLRQRLYEQFMSRAYPANGQVLMDLLIRRHAYASLLGYDTWASYITEDKMIRSAEATEAFIGQIAQIARPRMVEDMRLLLERKRADDPKAKDIQVWDRFYYVGKVREANYGFDARDVRPYFPYTQVRTGILDLYGELFGLRFVADEDAAVWHESVEAFDVYEGDAHIARFFLDMHPRDGKYQHAAMFPIQTGLENGRRPLASLVCNFPDPSKGDGNALMEHKQVVTYFHEFGHLIHHLLATRGDYVKLAGINVEWDFVEAPSQILEEWAWDVKVLQRFAHHVETGDPIPTELVKKMRDAEEFGLGANVMRQVFYSAYSFFLHNQDPAGLTLDGFTDEIFRDYSPYPRFDGSYVYANFGHLIGYSAIYYTYQWSLAISKDLFTRFEAAGLEDPKVAKHYRQSILEPGGTEDAADMVRTFLERETNLDAYKRWLTE
jgi:thimet oligopeptidase